MKKVFMILLAAVLLLSMVGVASAGPTIITNVSNQSTAQTNITLNLENNYKITIPSEINFAGSVISNNNVNALKYTANAEVKVEITLLPANSNISVSIWSPEFNVSHTPQGISDTYYTVAGSWGLTASTTGDKLHYVISTGSSHLGVDDLTNNKKQYVIPTSQTDKFIGNDAVIFNSSVSGTVPLHAALIDVPQLVETYTGTLKFTVGLS